MIEPRYLGDGVYVQEDADRHEMLAVTTGSHLMYEAENTVWLEPQVAKQLAQFINEWLATL